MELPNRDQEENALAALLLVVFEEWERDLIHGGFVPWEAYRARVEAILTQRLAGVFLLIALLFGRDRGFSLELDSMAAAAVAYASARASEVATNLRASVQAAYQAAVNLVFGGGPTLPPGAPSPRNLRDALAGILSRARALTLATTEVTQAQSAGNIRAVQEYQARTGLVLEGIWITERDARVCPICAPLQGTTRAEWGDRFPLGPPAHPNCRCSLSFQ